MAKKGLLVLVLAAAVATGSVFAQGVFSAGGGFIVDGGGMGSVQGETSSTPLLEGSMSTTAVGFGGFLFADAKFAELAVAFMGGPTTNEFSLTLPPAFGGKTSYNVDGSFAALDLSLLGKIPFSLGNSGITIFPLLGVGYNIVLSQSVENPLTGNKEDVDNPGDFSQFRVRLGVGGDFDINQNLYFRGELLGHVVFPSKATKDMEDSLKGAAAIAGGSFDVSANPNFGFGAKLAVGYRF